jgi:hypothetical protein
MLLCSIGAPPNGIKKAHKDPQVGKIYSTKDKLRNKPVTKLSGIFFQEK